MPAELRQYTNLAEMLASVLDEWHETGLVARVYELDMCRVLHTSDQHFDSYYRAQPLAQVQAALDAAKMHGMRVQVHVHLARLQLACWFEPRNDAYKIELL
jgi:hypothetical protein